MCLPCTTAAATAASTTATGTAATAIAAAADRWFGFLFLPICPRDIMLGDGQNGFQS